LEFRLSKSTKSTKQTSLPASLESDAPTISDLPQDFETALAQLEELVTNMESGALPLEESLIAYRRGVALTRICQERLAQAEQQISVLEAGLLRPFDAADRPAE
jgi:exodeoxyribonuclease VII small subunit